jgi:tRNA modification GTPase
VNHAILLTPPGAAAIAVVRLAGELTPGFLGRHFSRPAPPGRAIHGNLFDGDRVIDDPLVLIHDDGRVADLSLHGGPWVVRQVLELARREGFELIAGGRFPLPPQAVDGTDDIQRQMLSLLPLATTRLALSRLAAAPAVRRRRERLGQATCDSILDADRSLRWLLHPPRVAIVGAPNVGKSTLANHLFAQERSITADAPGTTRDWVAEIADIDGLAVFLIDTPGLRDTDDPIERAAIAGSGEPVRHADLILLVLDASRQLAEQRDWTARFPQALVIRNKCDLAKTAEPIDPARPHLHVVAASGTGIDAVRQAIRRCFLRPWRF